MKIGFVVNDVLTEKPTYTTTRLAMHATNMGHEAWLLGMGNFAYEPDGSLSGRVRGGQGKNYRSLERYLEDVQRPDVEQRLSLSEFDVVMLRNDPAEDANEKPWAATTRRSTARPSAPPSSASRGSRCTSRCRPASSPVGR